MPNLQKLERYLDTAAKHIIDPGAFGQTSGALYDAYSICCEINSSKCETADRLYFLYENFHDYQEDNFDPEDNSSLDYLVDQIEEIRGLAYSEMSHLTTSDSTSDNSDTDEDFDDAVVAALVSNDNTAVVNNEPSESKNTSVLEAPTNPYKNKKCSLQHLRTKKHEVIAADGSEVLKYETIFAELQRTSRKTGQVKYRFNPATIHHQQRVTLNQQTTDQGNTIVADLSFSIKAIQPDKTEKEFTITFSLDIPRFDRPQSNNQATDCFNFSHTGTDENATLQMLKTLYWHGRTIAGAVPSVKHGVAPKYDGSGPDKQNVYHTEQALVTYLCQPKAALMVANYLVAKVRSEHEELAYGSTLKINHAALHIHSDKTPCGACEFTLLGLQNMWRGNGKPIPGFTELLENALLEKNIAFDQKQPNSHFRFSFPGYNKPNRTPDQRGIRMFTLFSADNSDGTHRCHPVATQPVATNPMPTPIETVQRSRQLFTVNFGTRLETPVLTRTSSDTSQRTTFLSGSNGTPERAKSESQIDAAKSKELEGVRINLADFSFDDDDEKESDPTSIHYKAFSF